MRQATTIFFAAAVLVVGCKDEPGGVGPDTLAESGGASDAATDTLGTLDGGDRDTSADTATPRDVDGSADASADAFGDTTSVAETDVAGPPEPNVVLAGGGPEGDIGERDAWSARLYGHLLDNGDVTGDGRVQVVVLSAYDETDFIPRYFEWLGADEAANLKVDTAAKADDVATLEPVFEAADAVFIKGGQQDRYYDAWNERRLEALIRRVVERGGGIGGTSAGAMALADFCFAGGKDMISSDVLSDARTDMLDDTDGGSGVHGDFLSVVHDVVVDTHFTERGRLGRLTGIMAKMVDERGASGVIGLGIEQRTGLYIHDDQARVIGRGSVTVLDASGATNLAREAGDPLVWTDLRLDRLTDGWTYDLASQSVDTARLPAGAEAVTPAVIQPANPQKMLEVAGDRIADEKLFEWVIAQHPDPFGVSKSDVSEVIGGTMGFVDAHDSDWRADIHERLFRGLYEEVGVTGVLVGYGGAVQRPAETPARLEFDENSAVDSPDVATLVFDTSPVTHRSLASELSPYDAGDGSLRAAGLVGVRMHVLADTAERGLLYNLVAGAIRKE